MLHRKDGYTLLECLVSIALASLVLASAATATQRIISYSRASIVSLDESLATMRAATTISIALRAVETAPSIDLVRTRLPDELLLTSGSPHPLVTRSTTSAPRPGSQIISVVEVATSQRMKVQRTRITSTGATIDGCLDNSLTVDPQSIRSYLVVGVSEAWQASGLLQTNDGANCYSLLATPIDGFFSRNPERAGAAVAVYPVRREYSLFVDRSGNLRYVGHVGGRIIESQPIARGFRSVPVTPEAIAEKVTAYRVAIRTTTGRVTEWAELPLLERRSPWSELNG